MTPSTSIIASLVGLIAGMTFYLDSWRLSSDHKKLTESQRYRGLLVIIGGSIISPVVDKSLLEDEQYAFSKGYLFGVTIGWLLLFIGISLLYVLWRNTKDLPPGTKIHRAGQIAYSFIEIISGGIDVDSIQHQRDLDSQLSKNRIEEIKNNLKKEDPLGYVASEEKSIQEQISALKLQQESLEKLKEEILRANSEPAREAERLIQDKNNLIQILQDELALARDRQNNQQTQKIIDEYTLQLRRQEDEIRDLRRLIEDFRSKTITQSEFSRQINYKRINQYEDGDLFVGELRIRDRIIRFYRGDIVNLTIDVIVSSDDNLLTMGGGVSHRLLSVGGQVIYEEAQKLTPLTLGDVAITTAGNLAAQKVFHGVMIDYEGQQGPSLSIIEAVVSTCLRESNKLGYRSIAFPLLGSGTGTFPAMESLKIILLTLIRSWSMEPGSVNEAVIVLYGRISKIIDLEALIEEVRKESPLMI